MLGKLLKAGAYAKAPKKTFAVLHPFKALKWGAALWIGKKLYEGVRGGSSKERAAST